MNPNTAALRHRVRPAFFIPQPSDSIDRLVTKLYGVPPGEQRLFNALRNYTAMANPQVASTQIPLGFYVPRTLDFISTDPHYFLCTHPQVIEQRIHHALHSNEFSAIDVGRRATPQDATERDIYGFLAKVSTDYGLADKLAGTGVGLIGHMAGERNRAVLTQLGALHKQRQLGKIDRRAFVQNKKRLIGDYVRAVGPMARLLHGENDMRTALHQNRGNGLSPSDQFIKQANHLAKLAKKAKVGGLVLTATGAAMSVANMCAADTTYEKNVHLVRGAGSVVGGVAGGLASSLVLGVVVASGPVGWGLALVVSAVTAVTAATFGDYFADKAQKLYDRSGTQVDLASATGLARVCR